jgi:nijmegen breakage syndrome protein 1
MRTLWIIDGGYMSKSSPERVDYLKMRKYLEKENGAEITDAFYLTSTPNVAGEALVSFYNWMKMAPPFGPKIRIKEYKTKDVHVRCSNCGGEHEVTVQKGVDVGIATLAIKMAVQDQYDRLILSAGDGDFEDAIEYIRQLHKEFWITGFNRTVSADLQSYAHRVIWLDETVVWNQIRK